MTHRANLSPRWTAAEDTIVARAKRDGLATGDIVPLLRGRTLQSIDNRVGALRAKGVDVGHSRRGRKVLCDAEDDRDFEHFRARTTAASAKLLAAIVNLANQGPAHVA